MVTTEVKARCWFCGNTEKLEYAGFGAHVGGQEPDVPQYRCVDQAACKERQCQIDLEWQQA